MTSRRSGKGGQPTRRRAPPSTARRRRVPKRPRTRPSRPPAHRLVALLAALALGFGAILVRLVVLQVADASAYQELALSQRLRYITIPAVRGSILDRGGHRLALSLPARAVFADPALVQDPPATAQAVAEILDLNAVELEQRIAGAPDGSRFVYLARGVPLPLAREIEDRKIPGIGFLEESRRFYPSEELASQLIGFVGSDGSGLEGLEREFDELLAGQPGYREVERARNGALIPQGSRQDVPPVAGSDIVLTIDQDLQYHAEVALARAVRMNKAKSGSLIAMDPRTGEILAMANYPSYDPNQYADATGFARRNRAVTDIYEPGSVNKVIAASAALEEGAVNLNERFNIPDHIQVYDRIYDDAHTHDVEEMTLGDIVAYSSNVGAIKVAQRLGAGRYATYLARFGFGRETGIDFPGESPGMLLPVGSWSGTTLPSISIGQGVAVTALQMTSVYATIANGGVLVPPRLVRAVVGPDGNTEDIEPDPGHRVVSPETADAVTRMLAYAVEVGTGANAQILPYWVAGKTGTAQKALPDGGGYSEDRYVASFVGFVPASRPELVVAVVLDEPESRYGAVASAPTFQDVARFALGLFRIPPAAKPPIPPHAVPTG